MIDGPSADEADVELPALEEMLDEGGLFIGAEDLPRLLLEGLLGLDDGAPVEADAGVLLGRVDDEGEAPLELMDGRRRLSLRWRTDRSPARGMTTTSCRRRRRPRAMPRII